MANQPRGFAAMSEEERRDAAQKGGRSSGGQFGKPGGADPSAAGKKGSDAEPRAAKVRGGQNSHRGTQEAT